MHSLLSFLIPGAYNLPPRPILKTTDYVSSCVLWDHGCAGIMRWVMNVNRCGNWVQFLLWKHGQDQNGELRHSVPCDHRYPKRFQVVSMINASRLLVVQAAHSTCVHWTARYTQYWQSIVYGISRTKIHENQKEGWRRDGPSESN